jgi:methionyl-tRNA formyltransferase
LRLVFFGTPAAAVPSLLELARRHVVVLVVTQPERGRGAGRARPVAQAASDLEIPVLTPRRAREAIAEIEASAPDTAAVVAFGQILPMSVLQLFPLGMVNLHFSLLPRWRGAAPVERAILAGDEVSGITTMLLDEGMDTGPLLLSREVPVGLDDRAGELTARMARIGALLLVESIERLAAGSLVPTPQDDSLATSAPKLTPEDGAIDWNAPAVESVRRVRACHPRPGAWTTWRGKRLKVLSASVGEPHGGQLAGRLVGDPLRAAAADRWVELADVQLEGRHALSGEEFAHGARIRPDEVVGG